MSPFCLSRGLRFMEFNKGDKVEFELTTKDKSIYNQARTEWFDAIFVDYIGTASCRVLARRKSTGSTVMKTVLLTKVRKKQ